MGDFDSISVSMSARSMDPGMWDDPNYQFEFSSEHVNDFRANGSLMPGAEKISDAFIYGSRFCEIYNAFNATRVTPIDPSRHLMSLCTQYLVEFCLWVRESMERANYIKEKLMDHEYLRPEVRNGIVMVIIYTFASIKATLLDQADMFTTLQDHERGLGIANKFSLRIYNDPYNYLSFLKSSISSLIDAGVIPDNERLNQPKKNKLKYENKEEFSAFTQIQNMLVAALDAGNNLAAKNLVNHVTGFWSQRGKFIRNRRFQSAIQFIQENPVPKTIPTINNNPVDGSDYMTSATSADTKSVSSSTTSYSMSYPYVAAGSNSHPVPAAMYYPGSYDQHASRLAFNGNVYPSQALSAASESMNAASAQSQVAYASIAKPIEGAVSVSNKQTFIRPAAAAIPINAAELPISAGRAHAIPQRPSSPSSSYERYAASASHNPHAHPKPRSSALVHPLTILNFDRVGMNEWKIRGMKIYELDSFLQSLREDHSATGIYLVDDHKIAPLITLNANSNNGNSSTSVSGGKFVAREGGLLPLREEFGHADALIASWTSRSEYRQFEGFIHRYCEASSQDAASGKHEAAVTLLSVWQHDSSDHSSGKKRTRNDEDLTSLLSPVSSSSKGVIVYETVTQMGLVMRKNLALGITHDLWCLLYPNDMYASSSDAGYLFEHYIMSLLPQYRSIALQLSKKEVVVKYCCHRHAASGEGSMVWKDVPRLADESAYRTIGTMSQSAYSLLSKLERGPVFHDFMLALL